MPGYELIGKEERDAVNDVFDNSNGVLFAHGFVGLRKGVYKVREFESEMAKKIGAKYCLAVSSGSSALLVALKALGVKQGDEVITSSFTFVATVEAIILSGAVPVLTEIDDTYNMDINDLKTKISSRTKVVIPVHMAGAPADMEGIMEVAGKRGIFVLEDSAQGCGGTYKGKSLGSIGDMGIYSFDFAKNLTTGEGGMVITNNERLFRASREFHDHGHEYNTALPRGLDTRNSYGFNFRMTEIQAAIGLAQLKKLEYVTDMQRKNKKYLKDGLSGQNIKFRKILDSGEIADTLIFNVETSKRADKIVEILTKNNIGTKNLPDALIWHYAGTWTHMFKNIPSLKDCEKLWPKTDNLLKRSIALPVNVKMSKEEMDKTVVVLKDALK